MASTSTRPFSSTWRGGATTVPKDGFCVRGTGTQRAVKVGKKSPWDKGLRNSLAGG